MKQAALYTVLAALCVPLAWAGADNTPKDNGPTVLDLADLKHNPSHYPWFDFRPSLKKLILAGTPESEHISILWYPSPNGSVGLHYHAKTESVFAIDGSQADAKGVYPSGTLYFNPPGSGHAIKDSSGFFVLAYASPPDFAKTSLIGEYTPARFDTGAADFEKHLAFGKTPSGAGVYPVALDAQGGMSAAFIQGASANYDYSGNYLLVIKGSCLIDGVARAKDTLVVAKTTTPRLFQIAAAKDAACLALGVSFIAK